MTNFLGLDVAVWSLGISGFALAVALAKDFILPVIFKPRIEIEAVNDEECPDNALAHSLESKLIEDNLVSQGLPLEHAPIEIKKTIEEHKKKQRWLRIRVKNKAGFFSRTAVNCFVKLIAIKNTKNQLVRPLNAFPLMWTSYATSRANLAKGEYHLVDLVFETEDERVLHPAAWGKFGLPNALLERKDEKLGLGVYTFKLGIYGDNFEPKIKEVKVELTNKFGELRFAE